MGRLPQHEDVSEVENIKLKKALTKIFYMVSNSNNLHDISKAISIIKNDLDWPFLQKSVNVLELAAEKEEE
mgnify:FL=1